jgi:hypothetical protein
MSRWLCFNSDATAWSIKPPPSDHQKKAAALWVKPQPYAIFWQDSRLFIFAPL